jgi:hypothetical protein
MRLTSHPSRWLFLLFLAGAGLHSDLLSAQNPTPPAFESSLIKLPLDDRPVEITPFVTTQGKPAPRKTTATLQANQTYLTVTFTCWDPALITNVIGRDHVDLWKNDNVELFIDPGHAHDLDGDWIHFLLTASGQIFDERGPVSGYFNSRMPMGGNPAFQFEGLQVNTSPTSNGWTAHIVLPWASFGFIPQPGALLGFNLNRTDPPDGYYGLFPTYGPFLGPDQWGHVILTAPQNQPANSSPLIDEAHARILDRRRQEASDRALAVGGVADNTPGVTIAGTLYGAQADERSPIGGGMGYTGVVTRGDFEPHSLPELIQALKSAQRGQVVFLRGDLEIDITEWWYTDQLVLEIPVGVTLAGDRGVNGSPGPLIFSDAFETHPLIRTGGPDVTLTGVRLRGPDSKIRQEFHNRSISPQNENRKLYYQFPTSDGIQTEYDRLTVANCEISGWSHGGVYLKKGTGHHIHHNYIHHNRRQGLGYGVSMDVAEALIERNLFEHNRHDIAATGRAGSGYEACHNIVRAHEAVSHHFDMHGGMDRKDGSNLAGDWMKIHHNAFYGSGLPVKIRGVPSGEAEIHHNWFPRHPPLLNPADLVKPWANTPVHSGGHTRIFDNAYGVILVK